MWRVRRLLGGLVCRLHNGHTFDAQEWDYKHADDTLTIYCVVCRRPWWSTPLADWPDEAEVRAILAEIAAEVDDLGDDYIYVSTDDDRRQLDPRLWQWPLAAAGAWVLWWGLVRLIRWALL